MSDLGLLRGAVKEYLDMLRVSTEADGADAARDELLERALGWTPEVTALLFVTALEMLAEPDLSDGISRTRRPSSR